MVSYLRIGGSRIVALKKILSPISIRFWPESDSIPEFQDSTMFGRILVIANGLYPFEAAENPIELSSLKF